VNASALPWPYAVTPEAEESCTVSEVRPAAVIILAAGEGRRMKSTTPKVLHTLGGRSMLGHVLRTAEGLAPELLVVVVGQARVQVGAYVAEQAPAARVVVQPRQDGTGNAVRVALESVGQIRGVVVVTYGDTPLLRTETLARLVSVHHADGNAVTVLSAKAPDPTGYGRIVTDAAGMFSEIVEEADATAEQRAIDEINSGVYAFDGDLLADAVKRVATNNVKGEEYLTDVVGILRADGHRAGFVRAADPAEVQGVNDRAQLARARRLYNDRPRGAGQ
jgi:bifunctional UDP-N-acetylglucosamine pyrophosphorylase / glucosamine-1-phosphate N-acetyltransferase